MFDEIRLAWATQFRTTFGLRSLNMSAFHNHRRVRQERRLLKGTGLSKNTNVILNVLRMEYQKKKKDKQTQQALITVLG